MQVANWLDDIHEDSLGYILDIAEKKDVISLAGGIPDPSLFPQELFLDNIQRVYKNSQVSLNTYASSFKRLDLAKYS